MPIFFLLLLWGAAAAHAARALNGVEVEEVAQDESEEPQAVFEALQAREERNSPSARPAASARRLAGKNEGRCGGERWPVQMLADPDARKVDARRPAGATVHQLLVDPMFSPFEEMDWRGVPGRILQDPYRETEVYRVRCDIVAYRWEEDRSYRVVIADPEDRKETMTARVVDPRCVGSRSPFAKRLAAARADFERLFGTPPAQLSMFELPEPIPAVVTGVRIFKPVRGQEGTATNGAELTPILDVEKAAK